VSEVLRNLADGRHLSERHRDMVGGRRAGTSDQAEAWFEKGERICKAGRMRDSRAENDLLWGRLLRRPGEPR
jgi:hypothetical protein